MRGLEYKAGVFLVTLGGEAHIIELNFVRPGFGCLLGQRDVKFLNFGLRRIGPNQLPVLPPSLAALT